MYSNTNRPRRSTNADLNYEESDLEELPPPEATGYDSERGAYHILARHEEIQIRQPTSSTPETNVDMVFDIFSCE